ncbi:MAG TPA: ECF RNA polymerase sigma factor SigK [Jatrophihabitans sp.]|jgi:RNA polymerase sigma-70 factor (ECF subfamily)|uniref:ECF RNA polymerase sigma factor SigK n=1 Tax=Jatrophihabitans sp. TaxID=1932789 RepID=UPI002F07533A
MWFERSGSGATRAESVPPTLEELVTAASRGDERAFAELYDQTSSRVYGMVLRVIRDPAQSAEVTQDIYLEVWRQSARFDAGKGGVLPWLLMIAHRRAVDRVRAAQSSMVRDDKYALLHEERPYDSVSEQVHTSLEAQRVRKVLGELTPAQREAVTLAYFGGYTHTEVAELLKVPLGTAKTRIRDGLIRMRDALGVTA